MVDIFGSIQPYPRAESFNLSQHSANNESDHEKISAATNCGPSVNETHVATQEGRIKLNENPNWFKV
jgi:hypothetical protein